MAYVKSYTLLAYSILFISRLFQPHTTWQSIGTHVAVKGDALQWPANAEFNVLFNKYNDYSMKKRGAELANLLKSSDEPDDLFDELIDEEKTL